MPKDKQTPQTLLDGLDRVNDAVETFREEVSEGIRLKHSGWKRVQVYLEGGVVQKVQTHDEKSF